MDYANGMLDIKTGEYPDLTVMIKTMNRIPSKDEEKLLEDTLPKMLQHQLDHGYITEDVYDSYGHPKDKDLHGNVVNKNSKSKLYQRSKNLFRPVQQMH